MKTSSIVLIMLFSFFACLLLSILIGSSLGYLDSGHGGSMALLGIFYLFPIVFFFGGILLLIDVRGGNTVKTWRKFGVGIVAIFICLVVLGVPLLPWWIAIAITCESIFFIFGTMSLSALIAKKTKVGVWKIMFLGILIFLAFGSYLTLLYAPYLFVYGLFPFLFIVWVCVSVGVSLGREKAVKPKYSFMDWFFGSKRKDKSRTFWG